jgi:glycerol-3-phosphate dehydrogenase
MIRRDFSAATRGEFDLLVIGGGIYGVSLLREAARRGLRACLCEAEDFGGGTSWNSLRTVHGGLRYLQTLDLPRFFQSVAARRRLARLFPTLLRPLEVMMPLYGRGLKRVAVMRAALLVNDLLSARRNAGVAPAVRLPMGRVRNAAATQRAFPQVRAAGLEGAASWSDYLMVSSERIVIELLHDACRRGAVALNYAPVLELTSVGNTARGVRVRDTRTDEVRTIAARSVVNCTGPQVRSLARGQGGDVEALFQPSLAFNLMLEVRLPVRCALAVAPPDPGAAVLFVIPQAGTVLAGTMHVPRPADTVEAAPTTAEIEQFLGLLNAAIPGLDAGTVNVRRVFAGLLPVTVAGSVELANREVLLDHGRSSGLAGVYSVSGVKFTTAIDVARQALAMMSVGRDRVPDRSELSLSPASDLLTDARNLWTWEPAAIRSALRQVIEDEAVQCVDDLVLRRTNWAATEADLERVRERVVRLVGPEQLPG